ncbi:MAG TPA: hypothetical protein VLD36_15735 [Burkholderiales bacterium]|nr:hypothetical protein [Burkholderiales bacterium]
MSTINVTAAAPAGLASGALERIGGLIREVGSERIVAFVRELREIGRLKDLAANVAGLLGGGAGFGVLNLGVATMGFMVMHRRVGALESRLQRTQAALAEINQKLDLSFYANLGAALNLADGAFAMRDAKNRDAHATEAINRLMEAIHHYSGLLHAAPNGGAHGGDAYLATLCLAYAAVARCYLELDELEHAERFLDTRGAELEALVRRHVCTLLTSNPAAYLHPSLKGKVDLRRLTRVCRWMDPTMDENGVFEALRYGLADVVRQPDKWIESLPPSVWDPKVHLAQPKPAGGYLAPLRNLGLPALALRMPGFGQADEAKVFERLPQVMDAVEGIIEDARRFDAYRAEIGAVRRMRLSFREWQNLPAPSDANGLMFINLLEPFGGERGAATRSCEGSERARAAVAH